MCELVIFRFYLRIWKTGSSKVLSNHNPVLEMMKLLYFSNQLFISMIQLLINTLKYFIVYPWCFYVVLPRKPKKTGQIYYACLGKQKLNMCYSIQLGLLLIKLLL